MTATRWPPGPRLPWRGPALPGSAHRLRRPRHEGQGQGGRLRPPPHQAYRRERGCEAGEQLARVNGAARTASRPAPRETDASTTQKCALTSRKVRPWHRVPARVAPPRHEPTQEVPVAPAPCSSSVVSTSKRNFLTCAGDGSSIESPIPLAMEKAMSALDTVHGRLLAYVDRRRQYAGRRFA